MRVLSSMCSTQTKFDQNFKDPKPKSFCHRAAANRSSTFPPHTRNGPEILAILVEWRERREEERRR